MPGAELERPFTAETHWAGCSPPASTDSLLLRLNTTVHAIENSIEIECARPCALHLHVGAEKIGVVVVCSGRLIRQEGTK